MGSVFVGLTSGFYLGIGGLLLSLLILCIGLLADLLKQIMDQTKWFFTSWQVKLYSFQKKTLDQCYLERKILG